MIKAASSHAVDRAALAARAARARDPQTVCGEEPLGQHGVDGDAIFLWQAATIAPTGASCGALSTGVTAAGCSCSSSRRHRAGPSAAAAPAASRESAALP